MALRDWELWHRAFEAMTALGTVGATIVALVFGVRSITRERRQRRTQDQRAALEELIRLTIASTIGGIPRNLQGPEARVQLLRLRPDQATLARLLVDGLKGVDESTLRKRTGVVTPVDLERYANTTTDAVLRELVDNMAAL